MFPYVCDSTVDLTVRCKVCNEESFTNVCKNCFKRLFEKSETELTFAFRKEIETLKYSNENIEVLDLMGTSIKEIKIDNLRKLKRLRASFCNELKSVDLLNCLQLTTLDVSMCPKLQKFYFEYTHNIKVFNVSGCSSLDKIDYYFLTAEYISFSQTKIKEMDYYPHIKYLDISDTYIKSIKVLENSYDLQTLKMNNVHLDDSDLSFLTNLKHFCELETNMDIKFTNINPYTSLYIIYAPNCTDISFTKSLRNYNGYINGEYLSNAFNSPFSPGDYSINNRCLFGPYPATDFSISLPHLFTKAFDLPVNVDEKSLSNLIAGIVFGSAIADMLSVASKTLGTKKVNLYIETPIDVIWNNPKCFDPKNINGLFSEITVTALPFLQSCNLLTENSFKDQLSCKNFVTCFARQLKQYVECGLGPFSFKFSETLVDLVKQDGYLTDPIKVSEEFSKKNKFTSVDAVLCSLFVGLLKFDDDVYLMNAAKLVASLVHHNKNSIFASIALSLLLAKQIQFRLGLIKEFDVYDIIDSVHKFYEISSDMILYLDTFIEASDFDQLGLLDNKGDIAFRALGCAALVLKSGMEFEIAAESIIRSGQNVAAYLTIVGAVTGAMYGFYSIPTDLVIFFYGGKYIYNQLTNFLKLYNIDFATPTYDDYVNGIIYPKVVSKTFVSSGYQQFIDIEQSTDSNQIPENTCDKNITSNNKLGEDSKGTENSDCDTK